MMKSPAPRERPGKSQWLTVMSLLIGCGQGQTQTDMRVQMEDGSRGADTVSDEPRTDALVEEAGEGGTGLRAEIQSMIDRSPCPGEPCPLVTVTPAPAPATPASQGQRILLIDDGLVTQAATRYPSRVLAFVKRDGHRYLEYTPRLEVGRDALEILTRIDAEPGEVPSRTLDLMASFRKFLPQLPDYGGHGMDMLPFLAERVPAAQFVISEDQLDAPVDCGILDVTEDSDPQGSWSRFVDGVEQIRASLSGIIEKHGINVLHLSWGITHQTLVEELEFHCQRRPGRELTTRIMLAYVELFRRLTALSTPGPGGDRRPVLIFQAAWPSQESEVADNRLDCADIPGRIRLGALSGIPRTEIPCAGTHDYSILPAGVRENLACTDVMIALGYSTMFDPVREGKYWSYIPFGLSGASSQVWPASNSFANPVGLAHYLYLQSATPAASPQELLLRLTQKASLPILDPLFHDAFPHAQPPDPQALCAAPPPDR
jgi:hypothetical protein